MPAIDYARSINLNQRVLGFQLILRVGMTFKSYYYDVCPLKDCKTTVTLLADHRVSIAICLHTRNQHCTEIFSLLISTHKIINISA